MNIRSYPGNELDIFSQANNWKKYFSSYVHRYLQGHVLEVGAGIGGTTRALYSANCQSWTCLEPDPILMEKLATSVKSYEYEAEIKLISGSVADIDPTSRYDTILYVDVLEHIEDDKEELINVSSLLSKNGKLIILSPAYQWLYSEFDEAVGHFRRYTKRTLLEVIPEGMQINDLRYLDSIGLLASFANKILLHKSNPSIKQLRFWDKVIIPLSRLIDPLLFNSFGKSIFGVWMKNN